MRKHRFALLAIVLVICLALVSCDNGTTSSRTKFEGRWVRFGAIVEGYTDYSFTFSRNNFIFRTVHLYDSSRNDVYTGTFTFTDNVITWIPTQGESWSSFSQTYAINTRQLMFGNPPPGSSPPWWAMTFDKE